MKSVSQGIVREPGLRVSYHSDKQMGELWNKVCRQVARRVFNPVYDPLTVQVFNQVEREL